VETRRERFTTQFAGPAGPFVSLYSHVVFLVMGPNYMLLIANPSMSLAVALLMMFMSDVLSQIEANCPVVYDTSNAEGSQPMPLLEGCQVAM